MVVVVVGVVVVVVVVGVVVVGVVVVVVVVAGRVALFDPTHDISQYKSN